MDYEMKTHFLSRPYILIPFLQIAACFEYVLGAHKKVYVPMAQMHLHLATRTNSPPIYSYFILGYIILLGIQV